MNATQLTVTLLALVASPALAIAAQPTLKVGDPAPKLQTGKWIQGEPVKEFQKDKAYIVEFWATWCGPCRDSIPHLNETYEKYKDKGLVVIGQDCWERNDTLPAPFVKQMGDKMTYRVALDDKSENEKGKMAETWMTAAGRNGIPSAFLVDKQGLIAWIGHPMELQEKTLESVLDGTFDTHKAATEYETSQKNEAQLRSYWQAINNSMRQKQWDQAQDKLDEAAKLMSEDQRDSTQTLRANILFGKEDYPAAYKLVTKISDAHKDNPMLQNELAWQIATDPNIKERDLKVAELCANRANDASHGKDPGILDTVARIKFMQGQKEEAVALQEKAVDLADPGQKAPLERTLESYKRGELSKAD
jgi:thiol-disulfide isomerase/thioredoxin/Flp pilus assembly protein TadD